MHKVFFDNKTLLFCPNSTARSTDSSPAKSSIKNYNGETSIKYAISTLRNTEVEEVTIEALNTDEAFDKFKSLFTIIQAGGGFVYTPDSKLLMIFRRKKWDLPKGKLDEGEDLAQCSLREVAEETGVDSLQLKQSLIVTYHTYIEKGEWILKESHWYLMEAKEETVLTPQQEEDIERCEWVRFSSLEPYLSNTHLSIKEVIEAGLQALKA